MTRRRRKGALRKRYGRRYGRMLGPQAITRPAGHGLFDVVLVDGRGTVLRPLARKVSYEHAVRVVRSHS